MTRLTRAQRDDALAYWIELRGDLAARLQAEGDDYDDTARDMLRAEIESADGIIQVLRCARCID